VLPRERVAAAFEQRPTDKVPTYQAGLSSRVASALLGREAYVGGGIQQWRESRALWKGAEAHRDFLERTQRDTLELATVLDLDYVRPAYWRLAQKPARRIDEYTFLYGDPDGSHRVMRLDPRSELYQVVEQEPPDAPTLDVLQQRVESAERALPDFRPAPSDYPEIVAAVACHGAARAVPGVGIGLSIPYRPQAWLAAVAERPALVARHLDAQVERAIRVAEVMARIGVRYLHGGGDFASNRGPNYSPRAFRALMLPRLRRLSNACHRLGLCHMFASDGNLWPVADDLFGASGVDAYYEIDRRAGMDLAALRERFPHLTLLGNISSHTLHVGSRDEVIAETMSCLEVAHAHGGVIVGASNQIVAETPMDNVTAMLETIRDNR